MKQTSILWLSAIIITLIAGYINSITTLHFPAVGKVGIEGKKVTYVLKRRITSTDNYTALIKSDMGGLNGFIEWNKASQNQQYPDIPFVEKDNTLIAKLPDCSPNEFVNYRVVFTRGNKTIFIPSSTFITAKAVGSIPLLLKILFTATLFGGIVVSTRTGLGFFRADENFRKPAFITAGLMFVNALLLTPFYKFYESGAASIHDIPLTQLFIPNTIIILIGWAAVSSILIKNPKLKIAPLLMGAASLVLLAVIR